MNETVKCRRTFLRGLVTAAVAATGGCAAAKKETTAQLTTIPSVEEPRKVVPFNKKPADVPARDVAFVIGTNCRQNAIDSLQPFKSELLQKIGNRRVVLKINLVIPDNPLTATHPDTVRGIIDVLREFYDGEIIVAESNSTNLRGMAIFDHYGHTALIDEYDNLRIMDLNEGPSSIEWILDHNLYPNPIHVSSVLEDDNNFVISVSRPKSHGGAVATLTVKNMAMGAPLRNQDRNMNEKWKMHANTAQNHSPKMLHFNMFKMMHHVWPDFAILDGVEGMEGNGPRSDDKVEHGIGLAGFDALAVDRIGIELMGVPFEHMGYLQYMAAAGLGQGDMEKINIIGPDIKPHVISYKLPDSLLLEVFTNEGTGTLVVNDIAALTPAEQAVDGAEQ